MIYSLAHAMLRSTGLLLPLLIAACSTSSVYIAPSVLTNLLPHPPDEPAFEIYLIGDAGGATSLDSEPALRLLRKMTESADPDGAVIFLGDNLYCCGLPDSAETGRARAEMRLMAQIRAVRNYKGRVVFVPGNHDWGSNDNQGVNRIRRQEVFIESQFGGENVFLPDNGLPGPIEVKLKDGLRLVLLDTQWWMTDAMKPYGDSGDAEIHESADFILELEDLLRKRRKEDLIVIGHHPIRSNGRHGGHFSLKDHVFPLTAINENYYLPLPIIGSLYPILRRLTGGPQDFSSPKYRSFRDALDALFMPHEGRLIYASGHEHNLQYFTENNVHYLISGSGSKTGYVAPGGKAMFTSQEEGFLRVRVYENGEIWLEAWKAEDSSDDGRLIYHTRMEGPLPVEVAEPIVVAEDAILQIPADSTVTLAAMPGLEAGGVHRFFFGSGHRKAWTAEVEFPVFDIGRESGGLTPIKRGGGLQTTSLRLQDAQGRQFVLRSVSKDPTGGLPPGLENTIAADILIDSYAALHPYAAVIVPKLAHGAGVYHSNPKIVLVPKDDRFGPFRDVVADQIMLFEERPDEDMSHAPSYGRSRNVIGTVSMTKNITSDNDARVDELVYARARLFDMYLSDWDRHSDQWRWAEVPNDEGDGKSYRAIPRDRDWAMSRMNGIFPRIVKSRFVLKKNQDFRETYGYIWGLTQNGRPLDRRLTTSLTRDDWLDIARDIQAGLTDELIDSAIRDWPVPIQDLYADDFRHLFKVRREKLPSVAEEYFEILSRFPDVVGSNKHERFEIRRLSDDRTEIVMYKTSKAGEIRKELFRRTFLGSETEEVRLYGLGGNDVFIVNGNEDKGIRIRAIGGTGTDRFIDNSGAAARRRSFLVYDVPFETRIQLGPTTLVQVSDDPLVNRYDPLEFGYPDFLPTLYFGSNQDDGIFLGGGGIVTLKGFRKKPFASQHRFRGNVSTLTQAFNLVYEGRFTKRIKNWDVGISASIRTPNHVRNFFGLGNDTDKTEKNAKFYQARFSETVLGIRLIQPVGRFFEVFVGSKFEFTDFRRDSLRFAGQPQSGISSSTFKDQRFVGLESGFTVNGRDSDLYPRQGFIWESNLHVRLGLQVASSEFAQIGSDFSFYLTPASQRRHTIAVRIGFRHNVGSFPFFLSSTLGEKYNLRGWRSTRFAGRTAVYQNFEIRTQLFRYSTFLAVGSAGALAFVDNGRVWTDGEKSSVWHQGFGAGFWLNFFDVSIFTGTVGFSKEEATVTVGIGFFY